MLFLRTVLAAALCAAAFGATCESQGGECTRSCNGGEWDFGLTCSNSRRMCCFPSGGDGGVTDSPVAPADPSEIPGQENCGVGSMNRIVSGENAGEHEWPWQISLWLKSYDMHICGGSLVSDQWVVTAAHCVSGNNYDQPSYFKVILGEHHLTNVNGNEEEREVVEIIKHENYRDRSPWPNDVALLKLSAPVSLGGRAIRTACLPRADDEFTGNDDCWITGWGDSKGTANENILQEIRAEIRTNEDCADAWGSDILDSHICNSDGSSGSCSGDSGGPLQCTRDGRFNLVGVVSWGTADCTTPGYPGVYTRVTSFTNWIHQKIMADAASRKQPRHY